MAHYNILAMALVFMLGFSGVVARLAWLQGHSAPQLIEGLERRRMDATQVVPRRGRILDRRGRVLAVDRPTQDIWVAPAVFERVDGRRTAVCRLAPLDTDDLMRIAAANDGRREFLLELAAQRLADENPMIERLADALPTLPDWNEKVDAPPTLATARLVLARNLLRSVVARDAAVASELVKARPWLADVGQSLYLELARRAADPGERGDFRALVPKIGRKRDYPFGAVTGHIIGYCASLDAEAYRKLRGYWPAEGDDPVPGVGELRSGTRVVFSVNPESGAAADAVTDEESILQLRLIRRNGRMEKSPGGYLEDSRIGMAGVEAYYNQRLRGRHKLQRWRLERPDRYGPRRMVPYGGKVEPEDGEDLTLTIDLDWQRSIRNLLVETVEELRRKPENEEYVDRIAATVVVMNPYNGALYAMVSVPDYDPNHLDRDWKDIEANPAKPMLFHAIGEYFQPGSVLKPIVGLAGLDAGKISPYETVECTGSVTLSDGSRYRCMERRGHGELDLEHALMVSCNPMFYELGKRLTQRELTNWLSQFGLGRRTGVDLVGEKPGLLPRKRISLGERFYLATGQGPIATTPLQMAVAYAALANANRSGAKVVRPHVVMPTETSREEDWRLELPMGEFPVDRGDLEVVRHGMWLVVQGEGERDGTGGLAKMPLNPNGEPIIEIAGKTGSAELNAFYSGLLSRRKVSHAWFCGYAPADNPQVVVTVLVEYGDRGGKVSAPLAKKIFQLVLSVDDETGKPDSGTVG